MVSVFFFALPDGVLGCLNPMYTISEGQKGAYKAFPCEGKAALPEGKTDAVYAGLKTQPFPSASALTKPRMRLPFTLTST